MSGNPLTGGLTKVTPENSYLIADIPIIERLMKRLFFDELERCDFNLASVCAARVKDQWRKQIGAPFEEDIVDFYYDEVREMYRQTLPEPNSNTELFGKN